MPSIRLLKAFATLAAAGHFRVAAEQLNVTQPALSLQMKDLEDRLGLILLERRPRALQLTAAGEALLPEARRILQAVGDLAIHARQLTGPLTGRLRLGVIPTVAPYMLPPLLPMLQNDFPQLQLEVTEDKTEHLVAAIRAGDIDMALLAIPLGHSDLHEAPLFEDPFYLVAPPAHPILKQKNLQPQDIVNGPLLLLDEGHCLRDQALSFCAANTRALSTAFRAASLPTLTELVANGMGITLLPHMTLKREVLPHHNLKTRALPLDGAHRTIGLIWRHKHPQHGDFLKLAKLMTKLKK